MRAAAIVRNLDMVGRLVIPVELRRSLDIEEKDGIEFYVDSDRIILRKYEVACVFCGNNAAGTFFKGKAICRKCRSLLSVGGDPEAGAEQAAGR